jgi:hypothetical protein
VKLQPTENCLNPKKNGKCTRCFPLDVSNVFVCFHSLNISGNQSHMDSSNVTSASNATFESTIYTSRKRPRYDTDDQPSTSCQLLDGINIIDDDSAQPRFVKLFNNSSQDMSLAGCILKRKVGAQSYEFKLPKGMFLKAGATTTVREFVQDENVDCRCLSFRFGVPMSTI